MKSVSENISLSTDLFHQSPWSTQCLILHLKFPSGSVEGQQPQQHMVQSLQRQMAITLVAVQKLANAVHFSSVQSLSHVQFFVTPWTAAHQASLSITNSQSLLKLMSIESVMPSNHLILCCPLLPLSIFPSIRVFPNESVLCIR